MSNFHFLTEWPEILQECTNAETHVYKQPRFAAILCRSALEKMVHWMYESDSNLEMPYDTRLGALIHEYSFKSSIDNHLVRQLEVIRKIGNRAAHGDKISASSSLISIKALHSFSAFLARFYGDAVDSVALFDESILKTVEEEQLLKRQLELLQRQLKSQEETFRNRQRDLQKRIKTSEEEKKKLLDTQKPTTKRRQERQKTLSLNKAIPHNIPEKATRKIYIDLLLKEAGWDQLREGYELEHEVQGLPKSVSKTGVGYADYVLWGNNGKPLAVIEAKRAMIDAEKGRHQAALYADCLEKKYLQRPIIFYTNGFETTLWDDTFWTYRQVQGFYTKDELQLLIDRRDSRKDLRTFEINPDIAGRYYQVEAVQRVAERFCGEVSGQIRGRHRRGLLVMATGSGKTRTAASIIDMLTKSNWAKRVLFLADRNALVSQAKKSIGNNLPHLSCIDLTKEIEDNGTRMVFSTYPTMMNKIDSVRAADERFYGVGHFDVIFVDEAHRSVYQKYKAIFDYFDAMVVGLTATPKTDIDHNTYELFDIEDDDPTYAYELNRAVADKYLVPPKGASVPLKFIREGIKYKELSDTEKEQYETLFGDPAESLNDEISSEALNRWLFNADTVDKVLAHVMEHGIHVEGGDKLGKTIIFSKNHRHALFIEERFNKLYPEYGSHFLRIIDNFEPKAQDLLERFCDDFKEQDPQIAVSVDMMDTGVDAPRVVNLVFFKLVRSSSKYWQMIGRGTRLRPNLFGPGNNKTEFLIFDFCQNFEFFDVFPDGVETSAVKPLSQRIFEAKLEVAQLIQTASNKTNEDDGLRLEYINDLHQSIATLDQERFVVRQQLRLVNEYTTRSRWDHLTHGDIIEICDGLSKLPPPDGNDELARRFDLLALKIQLSMLLEADDTRYVRRVVEIAQKLSKLNNVPVVQQQMKLIGLVQTDVYWKNRTLQQIEELRESLRDLIKYIDETGQVNVYTSFEDELNKKEITHRNVGITYENLQSYKARVSKYVRENKEHLVIHKIAHNIPITKQELNQLEDLLFDEINCGTRADYEAHYGSHPLGVFVRNILGLDIQAANVAFAEFINSPVLSADQMTFINKIIQFLTKNGQIEKKMLFEPPFTEQHQDGVIGIFDDAQATKIISIVDEINKNAEVS